MSKPEYFATCWRLALLAVALNALPSWAQWQWTDATGRKVFSDTAPPTHIPDSAIQRRPGEPRKTPAAATTPAPVNTGQAVTNPAAEKKAAELEAKKKQAEDAEKAKQKAEEQKAAQAKAENCQRAQRALASLNTESRVTTVNAQGERVIMDETLRNAEKARLQQIMQQSCRP
jgi:type IV secretory pathway VirB10-like protein